MLMRYSKNMTRFAAAWQSMMQQRDTQHWDQADFNILVRANMFKDHHSWWDHTDRCDRYNTFYATPYVAHFVPCANILLPEITGLSMLVFTTRIGHA